ncbi:hypothetical protein COW95_00395 [Candidatus Peregrinibacteria bacterium CG22_combo_CG10-13_8_21_14_all_49_11]|nr:MAG: hypothetical protein COW95_00395 [Candidatus Peregrinibacteria bacterium CG22_combo_CG10-13_8_21_14_all_49_11]
MKRIVLFPTLLVTLLLAACSSAPSDAMKKDDAMMEGDKMMEDTVMMEDSAPTRTVMIHSSNWEFTPNVIRVKKGERVELHLMGVEGNHGFAVPELGIDQSMSQDDSSIVPLPTDKAGTFDFFCNVPCGKGHKDMRGTIIIQE